MMDPSRILRLSAGAALALLFTIGAGCAGRNPLAPGSASNGAPDLSADTGFCVDEINRLRASVGARPLSRSDQVAAFSNEAASVDGEAHQAHKYFLDTNGGNGAAMAENEIPWWKLSQWGSVRSIVREGLAKEWSEGPGGGHYENMTGPYSEVACGVSIRSGEVTVSQDFR